MCLAPAIAPSIAACCPSSFKPLPALKAAPPFENCIITGALATLAASITAFTVDEPTTFTAGIANPASLATLKMNCRSEPVTTPGLTASEILPISFFFELNYLNL